MIGPSTLRALINALKGEVGQPQAVALLLVVALQDGAALAVLLAGLTMEARAVVAMLLSEVGSAEDGDVIRDLGPASEVTYKITHKRCSCLVRTVALLRLLSSWSYPCGYSSDLSSRLSRSLIR